MNREKISLFRKKMSKSGVLGIFMKTGDPAFVEAAGYAGMDYAILDMEHGPASYEKMQNNIRAAEVAGIIPVVRVDSLSDTAIAKALDIGAYGVQIPQITSADEARQAVRFSKYYPLGERGVCRFVRAAHYSATAREEYFQSANQTLVIIQLEGKKAIDNLDEILAVEGIDVLFIGPYDLSQSLGLTGQTTHPKVVEHMQGIIGKARKCGKITGTFTDNEETLRLWKNAGVQYISYSVDVGIFHEACRAVENIFTKLSVS